jgi:hypothetical protein
LRKCFSEGKSPAQHLKIPLFRFFSSSSSFLVVLGFELRALLYYSATPTAHCSSGFEPCEIYTGQMFLKTEAFPPVAYREEMWRKNSCMTEMQIQTQGSQAWWYTL